jgi:hypothetical protein
MINIINFHFFIKKKDHRNLVREKICKKSSRNIWLHKFNLNLLKIKKF